MMTTTRRCLAAGLMWLGFVALTAMPASAQVDVRYSGPGLAVPTINSPRPVVVLSETGERTASPAGPATAVPTATPTQVLASQASGAVAGSTQAPVQGLAVTGADIVTMVTVGLAAILLGTVMHRRSRPRTLAKP